ncbi:MAG: cold shock domain-containing protein [Paludibacter sp.]|jgi:cold shock CspA family protein|nr:cold shock domain-containing protein [Paludibacter sp.]
MYSKENKKNKDQKKSEKQKKKEIRRQTAGTRSFEDMIAYVDENGNLTDTPIDPKTKTVIELEHIEISTPKKEEVEEVPFNGRVEYYNTEKKFGFIKDVKSVNKYFFHINQAPANIAEGQSVEFEVEKGFKGLNAVNIKILK